MTKEEKLNWLENEFQNCHTKASKLVETIEFLEKCKEFEVDDLLTEYRNNDSLFVKSELIESKYEYILGGDGRSSAWSEQRTGLVQKITLINVYISDSNYQKFIQYIKLIMKENVKALFINDTQVN